MVLISKTDDVEAFKVWVRPPNEGPKGYDDRIGFMDALCLAVHYRDEYKSPLMLQELEKLYPGDVKASIRVAEENVKSSMSELVFA
ncbi:MAG: hypothetical protein LBC70_05290 [Chitinispirillales bacterium]|jgi:hypothetical protein|nr:hypothetical protein [Chitinispirillales bacterium]